MNHKIHPCSSTGDGKCGAGLVELTDQQKARIAQNLRLAKARLARKSHQTFKKSPEKKKQRLPLAELQANTLESVSTSGKFGEAEDSFFDDFDESVLDEIDKLCEKKKVDVSVQESSAEPLPSYLQKLNESQRDAALSDINKPLLILAGPGSGKTSTMVARVLTLLNEGVEANKILAMTFTTAAAKEMMDRVAAVVGKETSKELVVSTFHSFCLQRCRSHAEKLNRTPEFLIYGTGQQRKAVIEATRLASEGKPEDTDTFKPGVWKDRAKKWQQFVTQAKAAGSDYEDIERKGNTLGAAVMRHYEEILASCNALDYHDFIQYTVRLFNDHPDVLEDCHKTWPYILVDEFQDTSVMQYKLLRLLALHNRVTIVGDDDQSIFSFNGANNLGFATFRQDFPDHKEVRLHQNYRSTGCIVEAAKCIIQHNVSRSDSKQVQTDNDFGEKITVKECRNEESQCAFVVDEILKSATAGCGGKPQFGNFAVLYRKQITGRMFQSSFRSRKIPFNMHGVAFYRKKIVRNVIALLWTALERSGDIFERRVLKALYAGEKTETKKAVEYVERHARNEKCSFLEAAARIFTAKVSGTFNRRQLAHGKKVLNTVEMVKHLVAKEQSLSSLVSAVLNMLPQRRAFETRAVLDESDGKLLNEDEDSRTVLEYLLDDVSEFLGSYSETQLKRSIEHPGCAAILKAFLDHITIRETENFRARREDNHHSVTLTTMHQSKGLEWDTVFIVKVNELETPLLHEHDDADSATLEEERRLFYVAMTRARKKLYITYVVVSPQRQILQPSRFLRELPRHLVQSEDVYDEVGSSENRKPVQDGSPTKRSDSNSEVSAGRMLADASAFLRGFNVEARASIASLFHTWAKKPAFQDPKRLLAKVGFVIDERLRSKNVKGKDVLHALKCCLADEEAMLYADQVIRWEKLPLCERAVLQAERQEHFQQKCSERAMSTAAPTPKQIAFLRSFGCTITPTSRLHASKLIEQYKSL